MLTGFWRRVAYNPAAFQYNKAVAEIYKFTA